MRTKYINLVIAAAFCLLCKDCGALLSDTCYTYETYSFLWYSVGLPIWLYRFLVVSLTLCEPVHYMIDQ